MGKTISAFVIAIISAVFLLVVSVGNASAQDGKALFEKSCKMCHGADAKGNPKMLAMADGDLSKLDLTDEATSKKSDADLAKATTDGVGKMKGYNGRLSSDEVGAIVKHLRVLQRSH